jgi:GNAT superfamily N-acetyltransferase
MPIRAINAQDTDEIGLVARRMRATLQEVIDERTGVEMYSLDWLKERVLFHLDPRQCTGAVFVFAEPEQPNVGHTIVRIEEDPDGPFGLFSTTYVEPKARRQGIADLLLAEGESWMRQHGLRIFRTYTAQDNLKLIRLYEKHGYSIALKVKEKKMVVLEKVLGP